VDVGARLVTASGCAALPSRFSSEALLRFADNAVLRRCVTAARRAAPYCAPSAARDIPDTTGRYGTRRPDPNTAVIEETTSWSSSPHAAPASARSSAGSRAKRSSWGLARYHDVGRVRVLEVSTQSRVSYACDDCEEGEDCRCFDDSETRYFFGARGELLLALIPAGSTPEAWPRGPTTPPSCVTPRRPPPRSTAASWWSTVAACASCVGPSCRLRERSALAITQSARIGSYP
jgi:hypothetical protein